MASTPSRLSPGARGGSFWRRPIRRLKLLLRPLDEPQERVYPFVMYALKHSEALARLQAPPALGEERLDLG
ncbi:MAG: hypothetical protein ACUVUP_06210 [Thermaceae bacterium]